MVIWVNYGLVYGKNSSDQTEISLDQAQNSLDQSKNCLAYGMVCLDQAKTIASYAKAVALYGEENADHRTFVIDNRSPIFYQVSLTKIIVFWI